MHTCTHVCGVTKKYHNFHWTHLPEEHTKNTLPNSLEELYGSLSKQKEEGECENKSFVKIVEMLGNIKVPSLKFLEED